MNPKNINLCSHHFPLLTMWYFSQQDVFWNKLCLTLKIFCHTKTHYTCTLTSEGSLRKIPQNLMREFFLFLALQGGVWRNACPPAATSGLYAVISTRNDDIKRFLLWKEGIMRQTNRPAHPNIQWMTTFKRVVTGRILAPKSQAHPSSSAPQQKNLDSRKGRV